MASQEKQNLLQRLDVSRKELLAAFNNIEDNTLVYDDRDWRLTDVINHLTSWEEVSVDTLQAFLAGKEKPAVASAGKEDAFNDHEVKQRHHQAAKDARAAWQSARDQIKETLRKVPDDQWNKEILFPWGERGSVTRLVEGLIWHEGEHRKELLEAVNQE